MLSETIWLVGMMGAGKSSIGREVAVRLEAPFHDSDSEIESKTGLSVSEIFLKRGEEYFRDCEGKIIKGFKDLRAVVALGGGAVVRPDTAEWLARNGTIIYLRARAETIYARIGTAEGRPLLANLEPNIRLDRINELLAERAPYYERADLVIDTDDIDVSELATQIVRYLDVCAAGGEEV